MNTQQDKEFFLDQGYFHARGVLDPQELQSIRTPSTGYGMPRDRGSTSLSFSNIRNLSI